VQPQKEPVHSIRKNAQENKIRCFEYERVGHWCRDCPNRRLAREKVVHVVNPQKAQQEERRRSSENTLRQRVFEHCGEGVPKEADLFELGWSNGEVVVSYLTCKDCGKKGHCYDLTKRLSHYLYLLFFFFSFGLTIQEGVWESIMSQVLHSHMTGSHSVTSHDVT